MDLYMSDELVARVPVVAQADNRVHRTIAVNVAVPIFFMIRHLSMIFGLRRNTPMTASLDLDAYLERIEWTGAARPTFHTLAALVQAHMSKIPFENLDVLLGRPMRLDFDGLQRKRVHQRRGGSCFEHATLLPPFLKRSDSSRPVTRHA